MKRRERRAAAAARSSCVTEKCTSSSLTTCEKKRFASPALEQHNPLSLSLLLLLVCVYDAVFSFAAVIPHVLATDLKTIA